MLLKFNNVGIVPKLGSLLNCSCIGDISKFSVGTSALTRYFTEFTSALSQYGVFTSDVVLTGDFEIELDYYGGPSNGITNPLVDGDGSDLLIYVRNGHAYIQIPSASGVKYLSSAIEEYKLNTIRVAREGSVYSVTVNNNAPVTLDVPDFTDEGINEICRYNSNYLDGIPANLKIWNDGDRDTGTLVIDCPMADDPTSPYFVNEAAVLGSDVLAISGGASWTEAPSGTYTETGDFTSFLDLGGIAGNSYLLTYEDAIDANVDNGTFSKSIPDGSGSVTVSGGAVAPRILGPNGAVITPNSLKEIPSSTPYITKVNLSEADTTLYTQVDDGWVGSELWVNPATLGSTWSNLGGGVYSTDGSKLVSNLTGSLSLVNGNTYRFSSTLDALIQGNITLINGTDLTLGQNVQDIIPTIGSAVVTAQNNAIGQVSNNSVKRFLEEVV